MDSTFLATMIGAAVGVAVGAFIQFIAERWLSSWNKRQWRTRLLKEFQLNHLMLSQTLEDITELQRVLQPNLIHSFNRFLKFSQLSFNQISVGVQKGFLYDDLEPADLLKIDSMLRNHTPPSEQWINQELQNRLTNASNAAFDWVEFRSFVQFVETQAKNSLQVMRDVEQKLKGTR